MDELCKVVGQITSDVGLNSSDNLQDEINAMKRRIEDVHQSIETLAKAAEEQNKYEKEYQSNILLAKTQFTDVQQVSSYSCLFIQIIFLLITQKYQLTQF